MWKYTGRSRPPFADMPAEGQESVWDYPRPPVVVTCERLVEVRAGDELVARSTETRRVLETASPPTYYIPAGHVAMDTLRPVAGSSFCEWKGAAQYFALRDAPQLPVAWSYPRPTAAFATLRDHLAFYPGRVACYVAGERVRPQPGEFYGGWMTDEIVGPVKGEPGSGHW